jgi:hypothetical protein
MVAAVILAVGLLAIWLQLLTANALLRGIYTILEKHHRPLNAENDRWVHQAERDLRDWLPPGPSWGTIFGCLGMLSLLIVAAAAWAWWR